MMRSGAEEDQGLCDTTTSPKRAWANHAAWSHPRPQMLARLGLYSGATGKTRQVHLSLVNVTAYAGQSSEDIGHLCWGSARL